MNIRDEKIKEIAEALQNANDKILAVVYTLVMLTTEFSEKQIDMEEATKEREKKPVAPKKESKKETLESLDDFDEPLVEDQAPIKELPIEDDFPEETPKVKEVKKEEPKPAAKPVDDFDEDFVDEPTPAKKEEP